jgi:hypothetical protein
VKQRLPILLSSAALAVALLGSTSLGHAALDGVAKAKRATGLASTGKQTARRGPRGPRGYRGLRGFQGPPGDNGAPGVSNAYEFQWTTLVSIAGATPETATNVAAPTTALPVGKYAVTAQITLAGSGGTTYCRGRGPGPTGAYLGQAARHEVGSAAGTVTLTFGVDLAAGGTINVACWQLGPLGATAGPGDVVVVRVGDLTSIS